MSAPHPPQPSVAAWSPRWLLGSSIPLAVLGAAVATALSWRDRLPDEVASHWNARGVPDDAVAYDTIVAFLAVASLVTWVVGTGAAVAVRAWRTRRGVLVTTASVVGLLAGLEVLILVPSLDAVAAEAAIAPGWHVPAIALAPAAVAGMVWLVLGPPPVVRADAPPGSSAATLTLAAQERVTWSRRSMSRTLLGVGAGVVLLGVGMAVAVAPWLLAVLVPAALLTVCCAVLRVAVDERGLSVAVGPFGWPVKRVPLAEVRQARVIVTGPAEWGGWGYRASFGRAQGMGFITRHGEAVQLDLADGRRFVVTVDDAETAVRLVNALLVRQRA